MLDFKNMKPGTKLLLRDGSVAIFDLLIPEKVYSVRGHTDENHISWTLAGRESETQDGPRDIVGIIEGIDAPKNKPTRPKAKPRKSAKPKDPIADFMDEGRREKSRHAFVASLWSAYWSHRVKSGSQYADFTPSDVENMAILLDMACDASQDKPC